jgi:hypothetical protein
MLIYLISVMDWLCHFSTIFLTYLLSGFILHVLSYIICLLVFKVNSKDSEVPANKDFEWRWKTASVEIPFLIDVREEGSYKVPTMRWMEWCSGQHMIIFPLKFYSL